MFSFDIKFFKEAQKSEKVRKTKKAQKRKNLKDNLFLPFAAFCQGQGQ